MKMYLHVLILGSIAASLVSSAPHNISQSAPLTEVKTLVDDIYDTFEAKFSTTLTSCYGFLQSPNFPHSYSNSDYGDYTVEVPEHNTVSLKIQLIDLDNGCGNDYVDVFEEHEDGRRSQIAKLCGDETNNHYHATTNRMYLQFQSNSHNNGLGFQMIYYSIPIPGADSYCDEDVELISEEACNGGHKIVQSRSGTLTSPGYPNNYGDEVKCGWIIDVSEFGNRMRILWNDFAIEGPRNNCEFDWLNIYDPKWNSHSKNYCGSVLPNITETAGPYLFLTLESDYYINAAGFSLTFEAIYR